MVGSSALAEPVAHCLTIIQQCHAAEVRQELPLMNRLLSKTIRSVFDNKMTGPPFNMTIDSTAIAAQGTRVYGITYDGIRCFVVLMFSQWDDIFTIECAWSRDQVFPAYQLCRNPRSFAEYNIQAHPQNVESFRFRLCNLWNPKDMWWRVIDPEEKPKILSATPVLFSGDMESATNNAIKEIENYAIPYFKRIVNHEYNE